MCLKDLRDFQRAHQQWVEEALQGELAMRDARWSETIAVESVVFVESVKSELGGRAMHRGVEQKDGAYALRELMRLTTVISAAKVSPKARKQGLLEGKPSYGEIAQSDPGGSGFHWTIPLGVNYYGAGDEF